ncbi:MAG: type I-G CRISPR-associated helicase/endonuclease Cas3g [Candidatus Entotheonellia bacterium]
MIADDFCDYFRAVHDNHLPFPWQERLVRRVIEFGWGNEDDPFNIGEGRTDLLALPTASGKTAVLDIAVFHLATQLSQGDAPRTASLRIFFVIDRRIVVDEAFDRATRIARALSSAEDGILKQVADALRSCGGDRPLEEPLHVAIMRGGMYRDDGWAASPVQPTICVSTVDQVGSRLLFRGYGLSEFQWPIHAGLIGCDSLIILDEAHISTPFAETLEAVRRYAGEDWVETQPPVARPLQAVQMTATPRPSINPFTIDQADRANTDLHARLSAMKLARLAEVSTTPMNQRMAPAQQRAIESTNAQTLSERIVLEAKVLAGIDKPPQEEGPKAQRKKRTNANVPVVRLGTSPPRVIGIVVNRVATARRVFDLLQGLHDEQDHPRCHAILLTGRIRPYDRHELLREVEVNGQPNGWLRFMRANRLDADQLDKPLFVVATQTVEVGADLSFDALVTEAASLDALRQRFGRLDRFGRRGVSEVVIVARKDAVAANADDPVYGNAIYSTWKQLHEWSTVQGKGKNKIITIDCGIDALQPKIDELKQSDPTVFEQMCSPVKHAPVMLPSHVDAWCQTSPRPAAEPDVSLFLHGPRSAPPDVQIVWRGDLPETLDRPKQDYYIAMVNLVPPTSLEALPVPINAVRAWLSNRRMAETLTDVEGAEAETEGRTDPSGAPVLMLRWRGPDDPRTALIPPGEIRPGDTIVVPSLYGGCDQFGWNPPSELPVRDIGDACARLAHRRPVLRLHPSVMPAWHWPRLGADEDGFAALVTELVGLLKSEDEETRPDLDRILQPLRDHPRTPPWLRRIATELHDVSLREPVLYPDEQGWVVERRRRLPLEHLLLSDHEAQAVGESTTEDDTSWMIGQKVGLIEHLAAVRDRARSYAKAIGLSEKAREDLALAGWLHDIGKADPRFQVWLYDGDEVAAYVAGTLLAKSGKNWRNVAATRRARELAGYPRGGRHECLSALMLEKNNHAIPAGRDRELVMGLVGLHHGRGRPFMPVVPDSTPIWVELELDGRDLRAPCDHKLYHLESGWIDLFWTIVHRYGYWGLAYLEAILRLADHTISDEEQTER